MAARPEGNRAIKFGAAHRGKSELDFVETVGADRCCPRKGGHHGDREIEVKPHGPLVRVS